MVLKFYYPWISTYGEKMAAVQLRCVVLWEEMVIALVLSLF